MLLGPSWFLSIERPDKAWGGLGCGSLFTLLVRLFFTGFGLRLRLLD